MRFVPEGRKIKIHPVIFFPKSLSHVPSGDYGKSYAIPNQEQIIVMLVYNHTASLAKLVKGR